MKKVILALLVILMAAAVAGWKWEDKAQARGGPYQYIVHVHVNYPAGVSAPGAGVVVYDSDGGVGCTTDGSGWCNVYLNEGYAGLTFRVTASRCGGYVAHTFYYSPSYYTNGSYQPYVYVSMSNTISNGC